MNIRPTLLLVMLSLPMLGLVGCPRTPNADAQQTTPSPVTPMTAEAPPAATGRDLTPLFSKIWRITNAPSEPAAGSINVFLPNGTLLQTSCVETYIISGWTIDKANPDVLQVSENGSPAYTARILELSNTTLRLQRQLIPSGETQEVTLTAVEEEFVCPDLPK